MNIISSFFDFKMVAYIRPLYPSAAGGIRAGSYRTRCTALALLVLSFFFLFPAAAMADCSAPGGIEGEQVYNTTYKTMQFCDGSNWVAMKGGAVSEDTLVGLSCTPDQIAKWNGVNWVCAADEGITTETDPKIGTLTDGKWCTTDGSIINCTEEAPSGGGGGGALPASCTLDGDTLAWNNASNSWKCRSEIESTVFITSTNYGGDLGGVSGADDICQTRAIAGGLGGTWKAIISNTSTPAKDRLIISYPVKRIDGTTVADVANPLWSGSLLAPINVTELSTTKNAGVWANTHENGTINTTSAGWACGANWTDGTNNSVGTTGSSSATNASWIKANTGSNGPRCDVAQALYCISQ